MTDTLSNTALLASDPIPNLAIFDTSHIKADAPTVVLVDGSYYLFRCFHGLPPLSNQAGLPTNAVRGVLNALNKLINTHKPAYMAVAFDTKAPTFRHQMSEKYKANRPPMDEELAVQIPYVHALIKALGIRLITLEGYEADDIIGTLAYRACQAGFKVVISTGDKDMAQLVNAAVTLEDGFKGVTTDVAGVIDKFGIRPSQMIDYLTLMGDASDGIMGVPKVGAKTASKLLNDYDTLENIIAQAANIKGVVGQNILAHTEQIALDKQLATIVTNLKLPFDWQDLAPSTPDVPALYQLYQELEFAKELKQTQAQLSSLALDAPNAPPTTPKDNTPPQKDTPPSFITLPEQTPQYHTITTMQALDALIERLNTAPYFAIDTETTNINWQHAQLVGISIAPKSFEAYYIPLAHCDELSVLLDNQLPLDDVLAKLKPLLENPAVGKIGQHLKYDTHIFANYGINLLGNSHTNWTMDTMLASYVINASATRHNLDDLAQQYLGVTTTTFEDIAGKGAKQLSFDKIDLDTASAYACEDADITFRLFDVFSAYFQHDATAWRLLRHIEIPIAQILTQMEQTGILVARKFLAELSVRFDGQIRELEMQAFELAGEPFNVASPKQLGDILFGKLGLTGGKKTKTGQYSTSEATLAKLEHPLVDVVLEHRSLSKLKSTYTDALDKACDKQGRVHTSYHQALTSTGRLSSSDPNLQNIPIRTNTGRLIREAFIAPSDKLLLAADYSQIELRLMAHFSQDERLISAFHQGLDIHSATASEILNKPIDDITAMERRSAKAVNFGLLYGMSAFGLAKQLGIERSEAATYIARYFAKYPNIQAYMEDTKTLARQQGYVQTILGRKLFTPDINASNAMIRQGAERAAINAPLQGSAADIIKLAMIAVDAMLPKESATLLLQVHDELVFEVNKEEVDKLGTLIKTTMQHALSHTAKSLGFDVDFAVPLVVDIGTGANWEQAH